MCDDGVVSCCFIANVCCSNGDSSKEEEGKMRTQEIRYVKTCAKKVTNKFVTSASHHIPAACRVVLQLTRGTCRSPQLTWRRTRIIQVQNLTSARKNKKTLTTTVEVV